MPPVRFPTVTATCQVPGSLLGASGTITVQLRSAPDRVRLTDQTLGRGTVSLDGNGVGRWGFFSQRLDADDLQRASRGVRDCANGLKPPTSTNLRILARRLDELAASRAQPTTRR